MAFVGFGQYQAGDYSTDMWKGSIYNVSPINTSNWLGTVTGLIKDFSSIASSIVPKILEHRMAKDQAKTQKQIELQRLAQERLLAQKQSQYYDQLVAQLKSSAASQYNLQGQSTIPGISGSAITGGYNPSPAITYGMEGRGPMIGAYATEPTPTGTSLEQVKKYLPLIGIGLIILILILKRPSPVVIERR